MNVSNKVIVVTGAGSGMGRALVLAIDGIEHDKFQVYVGRDAKMMNLLYRLSPQRATRFMYGKMKGLLPG